MNNLSAQIIDDFQRKFVSVSSNKRGQKKEKKMKNYYYWEILAKERKKKISKVFLIEAL